MKIATRLRNRRIEFGNVSKNVLIHSLPVFLGCELFYLNYKDNTQKAEIFLNELGNPYKFIISDLDGTVAIEWGAYGVPETFLINKKKIIKKIIGPINEDSFLEIKKIIK